MPGIRALWWVEARARMIQCDVVADSEGAEGLTVRYAYAHNGENYIGNRFGFFDGAPKTKWAADYLAGREVTVFINPQNPSEALLRREMTLLHWLLPGIFALIAAGCEGDQGPQGEPGTSATVDPSLSTVENSNSWPAAKKNATRAGCGWAAAQR